MIEVGFGGPDPSVGFAFDKSIALAIKLQKKLRVGPDNRACRTLRVTQISDIAPQAVLYGILKLDRICFCSFVLLEHLSVGQRTGQRKDSSKGDCQRKRTPMNSHCRWNSTHNLSVAICKGIVNHWKIGWCPAGTRRRNRDFPGQGLYISSLLNKRVCIALALPERLL